MCAMRQCVNHLINHKIPDSRKDYIAILSYLNAIGGASFVGSLKEFLVEVLQEERRGDQHDADGHHQQQPHATMQAAGGCSSRSRRRLFVGVRRLGRGRRFLGHAATDDCCENSGWRAPDARTPQPPLLTHDQPPPPPLFTSALATSTLVPSFPPSLSVSCPIFFFSLFLFSSHLEMWALSRRLRCSLPRSPLHPRVNLHCRAQRRSQVRCFSGALTTLFLLSSLISSELLFYFHPSALLFVILILKNDVSWFIHFCSTHTLCWWSHLKKKEIILVVYPDERFM